MNEFKVKRVKNGWILEYMSPAKSEFIQEVFTDGKQVTERLNVLVWDITEPGTER